MILGVECGPCVNNSSENRDLACVFEEKLMNNYLKTFHYVLNCNGGHNLWV